MPTEVSLSSEQVEKLSDIYESLSDWDISLISDMNMSRDVMEFLVDIYQCGEILLYYYHTPHGLPEPDANSRHRVYDNPFRKFGEYLFKNGLAKVEKRGYSDESGWSGTDHWLLLSDTVSDFPVESYVAYAAHEIGLLSSDKNVSMRRNKTALPI